MLFVLAASLGLPAREGYWEILVFSKRLEGHILGLLKTLKALLFPTFCEGKLSLLLLGGGPTFTGLAHKALPLICGPSFGHAFAGPADQNLMPFPVDLKADPVQPVISSTLQPRTILVHMISDPGMLLRIDP
ncbi:MAG: hypothetical protein AB7D39_04270 [Pseudodesulfovibrio sp.]|uniref:hypothetical protein n=1 Tax=Pseudodesulfovibrio sp. TaxID=2035812 RepID=UPI003D0F2FCF